MSDALAWLEVAVPAGGGTATFGETPSGSTGTDSA